MANFTKEQLQEIKNSQEFKEFVSKWENQDIDKTATLDDYLGNILNLQHWENLFSSQKKDINLALELAKTEHALEVYLHSIYADNIFQSGQNLPEKFWETEEYKEWAKGYSDERTVEYINKIKELQQKTIILQSQERYVPDLAAAITNHGFNDINFMNEVKSLSETEKNPKAKEFYEAVINAYEQRNGYLELNNHLKTEEDVKMAEDVMRALGYNLLEGTDYQGENSANVEIPVRLQSILVPVPVAPKEKDKIKVIDDGGKKEDIIQILDDNIKDDDNVQILDDILQKDDDKKHDIIYETAQERERSPLSDENEFLIDKIKLKALFDMEIISQEIYEQAIQNPSYAIEQINQKIPLKEEQQLDFENRVSDYMLENEETFKLLPPMLLAKQYKKALEEKEKEQKQDENVKSDGKIDAKISKLENRIDELSSNLYHKQDLFFADITNISDTYDGYMQMFEAREQTLGQEGDDKVKRDIISANRNNLDKLISDYDNRWNLQDVQSADADKLSEHFDSLNEELEKLDVNDETLKLVSNFQFINENNEPEPQFIDKDGNKTLKYSKGCQVAQNSKLANIIRVAKQNVLMEMLASKDDVDNEKLQTALNEKVPEVLYAAHVANQVEQGIKENPNQFTDKKYLNQFIADLGNTEKPMSVSPTAYEATIDGCVNAVGGFAHRLGLKIGKDKAVVSKLFTPLKDLDKRADDRTTKKVDKKAYRIEMLKRTIKGGASAFLVSGAITVVGTIATGGANKIGGMAVGSILAIGMTAYQIHNWNKDRKARGGKTGPKAFFKDMIKDRRLAMTIGTTALGAAAVGFAATGNPGVAKALGIGALALGTSNMAINTVQDAKEQGISTLEGVGWAALQSVVNVGAAFGGRAIANAGIDAYNNSHEDNKIFQHREKIGTEIETRQITEIETGYKDGVVENAQKILDYWYNDNPELLQQRIEAIEAYNAEHGTNINPQRYLLAAHDAGALSADNNLLHNQGSADTYTNAQHKVFGQSWSNTTGVSQDIVDALASSVNGGEVNITAESLEAFAQLDKFISSTNQVGYAEAAPYQNDGVLGYNAEAEASGRMFASENGDRYTTYADGESVFEEKIVERTESQEVDKYDMVRNETDLGLGMLGVLGRRLKNLQLKERMGSLLDRITGKKTPKPSDTGIIVTPPKDKQQEDKQTNIPTIIDKPKEQKTKIVKKIPQNISDSDNNTVINELIEKEYRITRGHLTDKIDTKHLAEYKKLVEAEYQSENSIIRGKDMETYLKRRMNTFEAVLKERKNDYAKELASGANLSDIGNLTRQEMWKRNISVNGEIIDASKTTLLHLTEVARIASTSNRGADKKASLSTAKGPLPEGKYNKPKNKVLEINPGEAMKERFDKAINQSNAQQLAKIRSKTR
ncbi:MAG: hypothetical protein E7012_00525 [Alphaproteobacteria bacterium]|nr:hypothetical protein [Alphaproteobacteria bacterium]